MAFTSIAKHMNPAKAALMAAILITMAAFALMGTNAFAEEADETPTDVASPSASRITMVAVGDDLIHGQVFRAAFNTRTKHYNFDSLFSHVKKDIQAADIAVINQETIMVAKDYSGFPRFGSPRALADAIYKAGFDVAQHATNHVMDRGTTGIKFTLNNWAAKYPDMTVLGIHASQEASEQVAVVERNGIKVAMLNYAYSTGVRKLSAEHKWMADTLGSKTKIAADIEKAKEAGDIVCVFVHWGSEYKTKPTTTEQNWAKWFANHGVDIIVGTHPHVLQPVRWVSADEGEYADAGHKTLCYYSLGNFVSCQHTTNCMLGGMARITIVKDEDGTRVENRELVPLVTHKGDWKGSVRRGFTVYKLVDYTSTLAKKNPVRKQIGSSFTVSNLKKRFTSITGLKVIG